MLSTHSGFQFTLKTNLQQNKCLGEIILLGVEYGKVGSQKINCWV